MQQVSVSSLVRYLKNRLDSDPNLQRIYVAGEISNYHRHFSGHLYFTLKDEYAEINCVMFKSAAASLKFEPKNGDKILVYANTSIFEQSGQLQLYILKMEPQGLGDLYAQYEALKNRLHEEGKFADEHKKKLATYYPERIGVLVGDHSAAMSDIKTTFARRWPLCKVDYYPVLVQGPEAPDDIIASLLKADEEDYDAIILARGGGSFEDLFCFNSEALVNTIYELKTFIITGIGHEQDFTLCDFVADLRAPTPTAAVELVTPDIEDVRIVVDDYQYALQRDIETILEQKRMSYDYQTQKLMHFQNRLQALSESIDHTLERICANISYKSRMYENTIDHIRSTMALKLDLRLSEPKNALKRIDALLEAYSFENVLKRGYTLIMQDDKPVKSRKQLKAEEFTVRFVDGTIIAEERK